MRLSKEQKDFIRDNYSNMKNEDICNKLNITNKQLHGYVSNLKLTKNYKYSKSFNNIYDKILEDRKEDYNINNYINKKEESKIDNSLLYKSKYGKFYVNQDYFEVIDNEWKAYWLGFLYADGCVTIKRNSSKENKMDYSLDLTLKDKDHLEKFRNSLQTDSIIKERRIKLKDNEYTNYRVTICNRKICNDLNNLGCSPNKTFSLTFPTFLNEDLIRHFVRGYFDGDGCIHINMQNKSIAFTILGTYDMLNGIKNFICDNIDITCKIFKPKDKNIYELRCYGVYQIGELYKLLYKDCNIYLERKLNKFNILYCLD